MGFLLASLIIGAIICYIYKSVSDKSETSTVNYKESTRVEYFFRPTENNLNCIKLLLFIGKADGQLRENEVDVIVDFFVKCQPEHSTVPQNFIASNIKEINPFNVDEYKEYINNMDKTTLTNFDSWVKKIIGTQKKNHPYEDILLNEIDTRLQNL